MTNRFDKEASEWDQKPRRVELANAVSEEFKKFIKDENEQHILDYGTGTGLIVFNLKDKASQFTAMDSSQGMLDVLQAKLDAELIKHVKLQKHDIENENLGFEKFDMIVTSMTLHHISDVDMFLAKAYDALTVGGRLCVADLVEEEGSFHNDNETMGVKHLGFNENDLRTKYQKAGFSVLAFHEFYAINKNNKQYPIFIAVGEKN